MNQQGGTEVRVKGLAQELVAQERPTLFGCENQVDVNCGARSTVPSGLVGGAVRNPALKRWAIIGSPSGTRANAEVRSPEVPRGPSFSQLDGPASKGLGLCHAKVAGERVCVCAVLSA